MDGAQLAFSAEVVLVYFVQGAERGTPYLRNPRLQAAHGQTFLSGAIVTGQGDHWAAGKMCHIPLRQIQSIIEIGSYEEHLEQQRRRTQG